MMKFNRCIALAGIVCLFTGSVNAAVNVGDKPAFEVQAVDGSQLSLQKYRGKIIIVDFWATWCGPCMAEAGHMVAIDKEFGPKGVQFIGISLDDDETALKSVIKEKGFAWPQFFDGNGWKNQLAVEWGVESIPATFILDPEGNVVWRGHPAQIDAALAAAMAKTPPMPIDPAIARDASAKLDELEKLVAESPEKALNLLGAVPADARKLPELNTRITKLETALTDHAKSIVTEADGLIAQGKFEDAATKLNVVIMAMGMSDAGKLASEKLKTIESNPQYIAHKEAAAKAKAQSEKLAAAETAMKDAQALAGRNRHEDAYAAYKTIARTYAGTPIAAKASAAIAA